MDTDQQQVPSAALSVLVAASLAASSIAGNRVSAAETLPVNGQIEAGSATIDTSAGSSLIIRQTTDRAVIGWDSFSVGAAGTVTFQVPGSASATLNRVNGATPSSIAGQVRSNGTFYLINPNGILITSTGSVETRGFIGSSLDLANADFLSDKDHFKGNGASADVTNRGRIKANRGGAVVLLGGHVDNSGEIDAEEGNVGLGSGEDISVDLSGTGLLSVSVPTASRNQTRALISQTGRIRANGGRVQLRAATSSSLASAAINVSGTIEANSVAQTSRGLSFGGAAATPRQQRIATRRTASAGTVDIDGGPGGATVVSGKVSATSQTGKGGAISVFSKSIEMRGALIDTSGATGGGVIRIGGNAQGQGGQMNAATTSIDGLTRLDASALFEGNGGDVVVWADKTTDFRGMIAANGGKVSGNGGSVEVSGKEFLSFAGKVDTLAAHGATGNLLLDPYDVTISTSADASQTGFAATGTGSNINVTTLQTALATSNVTVSTGAGGAETGNITVNNALAWSANTMLTLNAAGGIILNANITNSGSGSGLNLIANGTGGITGAGNLANAGALTFNIANAGGSGTFSGIITGSGTLTKSGAGTQSLGGISTNTGAITISGGTLQLNGSGKIGNGNFAAGMAIASGATFQYSATGTQRLSGIVSGAGNILKDGASPFALFGANTYTGTTIINGGTLDLGNATALGSNSAVSVNAGVTMFMNGNSVSAGSLDGSGTISNGSVGTTAVLTVGGLNTASTFAGIMQNGSGTFALAKTGTAKFTLTGVNRYGGNTTISGGTLQLLSSGTLGTGSYAGAITIAAGATFQDSSTTNLILSGTLSGAGSITKDTSASSTLSISGTNSITGATLVNAGTLKTSSLTGLSSGSALTLASGTTLDLAGNSNTAGSLSGSGTVTNSATATLTAGADNTSTAFSGVIQNGTGTTSLAKTGSGTWTLSGANTYTGTTTVNAGTLQLAKQTALYNAATASWTASNITVASGAVLAVNYGGAGEFSSANLDTLKSLGTASGGFLSGSALGIDTSSGSQTYASSLANTNGGANAIGLVKLGTNTLTLTGTNTFTGSTTVSAGTLTAGATTGFSGASAMIVNSATVLDLGGFSSSVGSLSGAGTVTNTGSAATLTAGADNSSTTFSGILQNGTGTLSLVKAGSGTQTLTGVNSYTGSTTINGGTLAIGGSGSLGSGSYSGALATASGAAFNFASSASQTVSNLAAGAGTATFSGSGTITISGTQAFTGTLNLNQTTTITGGADAPVSGVGNAAAINIGGFVTLSGASNSFIGASGSSSVVTLNSGSTLYSPANQTFHLTTGLVLNGGTLASAASLGATALASGSFNLDSTVTVNADSTLSAVGMTLSQSGGTIFHVATGKILTVSGTLAHTASASDTGLVKNGSGTLLLSGTNSYTSATTLNAGTLQAGSASAFGNGSATTLSAGATLDLGGWSGSIGSLAGAGTVTNSGSAATLTTGSDGTSTSFSGTIQNGSGATGLTKTGSGTFTLSGANTFGGTTSVSGGTLALTGSWNVGGGTATTSVSAGATLAGSGVVTAATLSHSGAGTVSLTGSNMVNALASTGALGDVTFKNAKSLSVGSLQAASILLQTTGASSDLTLAPGAVLSASGSGTPVILAASRNFINNSGSSAIILTGTGSPNWQIYSAAPGGNTFGNLDSGNTAVWNTSYGDTVSQTGNRYVFAFQPTVTFTSVSTSKAYGTDVTAAIASSYSVSGLQSAVAGAFLADTNAIAFSGTPVVTSAGAAAAASSAGSPYAMTVSAGTATPLNGYAMAYSSTGLLTLAARSITITADAQTMIYGNAVPTLTYTIGGAGLANGDSLTGLLATGASSSSGIGTYTITLGTLAAPSNYAVTYVGNTLTIGQRAITLAADSQTMTYGNATPALTYSVGGSGLVNGDSLTGALATTASYASNVGTYGITQGTLAASANYAATYTGNTLTIGQRAVTVTADAKTMTYGDSAPALTYSVGGSGLVNGDSLSGALSVSASSTSGVGTYWITQGSLASSGNYSVSTFNSNTVTVNQRSLVLSADAKTMTYGDAVPALTYSVGGHGLVNGDSLSGALATAATASSDTGTYGITQGTLAASSNYAVSYASNTVTIGQRALMVTADNKSMVYGDSAPVMTYTVTGGGLVNGDTLSGSLATTASPTSNTGSYAISQGSVSAPSNYALTYHAGTVTIGQRSLTITASARSMTYGNATPALTYSVGGSGLVNGDSLTGALATSASSASNVGTYGITQGTLAAPSNYAVTYTGNTLTIGQRGLTITADAKTMTYGNSAPALTYSVGGSGLVNGDSLSGALSSTASSTANAGLHAINQGTLAASSNYAVSYVASNVTIGQRQITITADGKTMTYGDALPVLTYTTGGDGLVNGDTLAGSLATNASPTANAGTHAITLGTLAASGNYAVSSFASNDVVINRRVITLSAVAKTMTYGNSVPVLTYSVGGSGLANGDALSGSLSTTATSVSDVGTYAITIGTLTASSNYTIGSSSGSSLTVTPRNITILADARTIIFGTVVPALTYHIGGSGLVNGDTLSGSLATAATDTSDLGTYGITQGSLTTPANYAATFTGNTLTIVAADQPVRTPATDAGPDAASHHVQDELYAQLLSQLRLDPLRPGTGLKTSCSGKAETRAASRKQKRSNDQQSGNAGACLTAAN